MTIDEIPDKEDIEQIVGLVNNKVKIKTLHEMIQDKTQEELEEEQEQAKKFVDKMREKKNEIDSIK